MWNCKPNNLGAAQTFFFFLHFSHLIPLSQNINCLALRHICFFMPELVTLKQKKNLSNNVWKKIVVLKYYLWARRNSSCSATLSLLHNHVWISCWATVKLNKKELDAVSQKYQHYHPVSAAKFNILSINLSGNIECRRATRYPLCLSPHPSSYPLKCYTSHWVKWTVFLFKKTLEYPLFDIQEK